MVASVAVAAAAGCSRDPEVEKQRLLESGNRYVAEDKLREAVIEYRNALQIDPRFGDARLRIAETYVKLGDGANALGEYVRAADLLPDDIDLQLTAGRYLLAAGQMDSALARADAVLERSPGNVEAHVLRGNALGGLNDLESALTEIEEAISLDPARGASYTQLGLVQLARGRQTEAEAALMKAVQLAPAWVGGHLALGNFYWAAGRQADAERVFDAALALDPRHEGANRMMAVFSLGTGRVAEAEGYLKQLAASSRTPSATFTLSDYYLATSRAKEAVALLQSLTSDTRAVGAKRRLAGAHAAAGDRPRAYALLDEILGQDAGDPQAQLLKGQLLLEDGKSDEALALVKAAVAAEPTAAASHFTLGKLYAARGDVSGAEAAFREVLKLNPRAAAAQVELSRLQLSSAKPQDSLETAEAALRNQPGSAEVRLALVRSLLATKDFARAEREIQSLLQATPQNAAVHAQSGILAALRNQAAPARAAFDRALSLDPQSLEPLSGLIALDLAARDGDAARARIDRRLQAGTPTPELLLLAARTYGSTGDLPAAERTLRQAIDASPSLLPAYSMLGQIYLQQRRLEEARLEFDALAERQTRPVGALTMSGVILQGMGNTPLARQRFERAVAIDPGAAVAANNLAWIYADAGEHLDQAVRLAEAAAEALPDSHQVLDTLGWVYYKNNLSSLAVPALTRAVEKDPTNPVYHHHLGRAYGQAGDPGRSRQSLERALELNAAFEGADDARRGLESLRETVAR